jgi:TIR domain
VGRSGCSIHRMALGDAAGFWSYTRQDDELDGGRIRRLADRLRAEFALLTGAELELFVDRDGIEWGDAWRSRIDEALASTTFFMPVITPRYFERRECRHELLTFIGHAKSLGLEELLLPILYVHVSDLTGENAPEDEAMAIVAATQWVDWRDLRLEDEDSSKYRQAVNRLAGRLVEISERLSERPPASTPAVVATAAQEEDEPGLVDLMAVAEEALPRWLAIVEQFAPVLEQLNRLGEEATAQVNESDAKGGGFAGRLVVARRLAAALEEPADKLVQLGNSYASELVTIDPGILATIRTIEEDPAQLKDKDTTEFLDSIQGFAAISRRNAEATRELSDTYTGVGDVSRVLRGPIRKIRQGLRGVLDGQSIIDEWDERIKQVRGGDGN